MTRDEIIRTAREAGMSEYQQAVVFDSIERFANLIAAAEREACAQIAEQTICMRFAARTWIDSGMAVTGQACAVAIRARSNT